MSNEMIFVWLFIRIELIFSFLSPVFVWLYTGRPQEITIIFWTSHYHVTTVMLRVDTGVFKAYPMIARID